MLSLFLNPITFVVGAALVSAPIIIHLINRIRFRRIKWAAMEFLLKAQKRMRRRKILEQLLLLLLRCLLVLLAGVLFGRFLGGCGGGTGQETRPTSHFVILDDTPSMADGWRKEDGSATDPHAEGRKLVYEKLMPAAAQATTNQAFQVLVLSDLNKPFPAERASGRIEADQIEAMRLYLEGPERKQPSLVRRNLRDALDKVKQLIDEAPGTDAKVVHLISDFRNVDWAEDGQAFGDKIAELKNAGATVHLIDVANPARKADRKSPPFSDNVAIVGLTPTNRVVAVNQQTEIDVRVKNFGSTDLKDVRVEFYVNGQERRTISAVFPDLPANQERSRPVVAQFNDAPPKDKPLERFQLVTAVLAGVEPGGLAVDNVRHTVIEVRPRLQVLVVDGRPELRDSPRGDSFYLRKHLQEAVGGIELVNADPAKLD
ncbi:MAG: BatA domain-containing protein, partial [Gemmataceae bacterium]|nr:BatA domain-containing protein [Gemmataceae bacterium]